MRKCFWILAALLTIWVVVASPHTGHKEISELPRYAFQQFRSYGAPHYGAVICSGKMRLFEADRDTTEAAAAGAAYQFTMASDGTCDLTYWYFDGLPGNSYDCYWVQTTGTTCVGTGVPIYVDLPDGAIFSASQLTADVIQMSHIAASESIALVASVATCYLAVRDTVETENPVIATRHWVEDQGFGGAGSFTREAAEDSIFGNGGSWQLGYSYEGWQGIEYTYSDNDDRLVMNITNGEVYPEDLEDGDAADTFDMAIKAGDQSFTWLAINELIDAGDNLEWEDPIVYPPTLNFIGAVSGYTQEEIEDFVGAMTTGNTETGLDVTYQDADGTLDFEIGTGDITGTMILDQTIKPADLDPSTGTPSNREFVIIDTEGDEFYFLDAGTWISDSAIRNSFMDAVGPYWDNGNNDNITVAYNSGTNTLDMDVLIDDYNGIQHNVIVPEHFNSDTAPNYHKVPRITNDQIAKFEWVEIGELFDAGDYCDWQEDASGTYTLNVSTLPTIDPLDIDYGDVATLTTTWLTIANGLTVGGERWDDGSGKITNDVFPDSCYIASLGTAVVSMTTAFYLGGAASMNTTLSLGGVGTLWDNLCVYGYASGTSATFSSSVWVEDDLYANDVASLTSVSVSTALYVGGTRWDDGTGGLSASLVGGDAGAIGRINDWATDATASLSTAYSSWSTAWATDNTCNDGDGTTHWTALEAVPAGFADGIDNTSAGGSADRLNDWATNATATISTAYEVSQNLNAWATETTAEIARIQDVATDLTAEMARIQTWATNATVTMGTAYEIAENLNAWATSTTAEIARIQDAATDLTAEVTRVQTWATSTSAMVSGGNATFTTASAATIYLSEVRCSSGSTVAVKGALALQTDLSGNYIYGSNTPVAYDVYGRDAVNADGYWWSIPEIVTAGDYIDWSGTTLNVTGDPDASPVADRLNIWASQTSVSITQINDAATDLTAEVARIQSAATDLTAEVARIQTWATASTASWSTVRAVDNPTVTAEGQLEQDANDDAFEMYSSEEGEAALVASYYDDKGATIHQPDQVNDAIKLYTFDELKYPHGAELDKLVVDLETGAAYTVAFERWTGTGAAKTRAAGIATLTTSATKCYASTSTVTTAMGANEHLYMVVPGTDVDQVSAAWFFHITEGD